MKRSLLFLCVLFFIGLTACEKTNYVEPNYENPNKAFIVTLDPNHWQQISNAKIAYDIPLKDLTEYYQLQGGVAVALSFDGEESYDVVPTTSDGLAYSVNYAIGWITIYADDPLADDNVQTIPPTGDVTAKIILTTTDYFDYQGLFKAPGVDFKQLK